MGEKTVHRGIRDLLISAWNSEDSYGTSYDVLGVRNFTVAFTVETDELRGDDVVIDRFTKIIAVSINVAHGSVDLEAANMLIGGTLVSNADYEDLMVDEDDEVPYVALAGRVVGTAGSTDLHMFCPKCKLAGPLNLQAQVDNYMIPSAEFQAINEGETNGMVRLRKFLATTALEIPLRTSTGSS